MRKEECLTRKWKEEIKEFHTEICAFKCRKNIFYLIFIYFIYFIIVKRESGDFIQLKGRKFF